MPKKPRRNDWFGRGYCGRSRRRNAVVAFSLRSRGNHVFLDRDDLPAGQSYDEQIEGAVKKSQIFIFLIRPDSVVEGRYALTELKFARRRWNVPDGHVLPVLVRKTPLTDVPHI